MSLYDNLNTIKSVKEDIKTAIINKGQDMTDVPFSGYAEKINNITTGGGATLTDILQGTAILSAEIIDPNCEYVKIGVCANNNTLTTVSLLNCKNIEEQAFRGCSNLTNITLPNCSFVGSFAFSETGISYLDSTNTPALEYIENGAFHSCPTLQYVSLPKCNIISRQAFAYCTSLSSISLPNCYGLGQDLFYSCPLTSIELPNCFLTQCAFEGNSLLTQVSLPRCSSFGWNREFLNCSLLSCLTIGTEIYNIPNYPNFNNVPFASGIGSIYVDAAQYSLYVSASGWSSLSSLFISVNNETTPMLDWVSEKSTIYGRTQVLFSKWSEHFRIYYSLTVNPSEVGRIMLDNCEYIENGALINCSNLYSLSLPALKNFLNTSWGDFQTYINQFPATSTIEYLVLPNLESVSKYWFGNCPILKSVNLRNCSYVGEGAFQFCSSLQSIDLTNCSYIEGDAFRNCSSLQSIDLPNCSYIGDNAFRVCSSLQSIDLTNCSYIGEYAFNYCSSLQSIDLTNCSYIGEYAFYNCSSLQSISLPNCSYIGRGAFGKCSSIQSIDLPNCSSIKYRTFYSCWSLQSISLPKCTSIGSSAFQFCSSLQSIDLTNCSYIGGNAFGGCPNFTTLILPGSIVCELGMDDKKQYLFIDSGSFPSIFVPASLVDAYKSAVCWSNYTDYIFPITE